MVKIVRVFLALFATLWYTTSPINSGSTATIWVPPPKVESAVDFTQDYYKPLEFIRVKYTVRDRCQFSWYCDGKLDEPARESRSWMESENLAKKVLETHYDKALIDITDGATHYHANWMEEYPIWSKRKKVMASIDRHIFYKKR